MTPPAVGEGILVAGRRYVVSSVDDGHVWVRTAQGPAWVRVGSVSVNVGDAPVPWRSDELLSFVVPGQIGAFG